jgi:hypothetical protein
LEAVRRKHQDAEAVVELFCARFEVSQKLAEARRDADEWRTPEALGTLCASIFVLQLQSLS